MTLRRVFAAWLILFSLTLLAPVAPVAIRCLETGALAYGTDTDGCHLERTPECDEALHAAPCCRIEPGESPPADTKRPVPLTLRPEVPSLPTAPVLLPLAKSGTPTPHFCPAAPRGAHPPLRAPPFTG